VYDNANFAYRNTEYFAVFQCKLMKKLLDLDARGGARVHQATTWSFYFEGERFFEGTRSLFTAQGIEKPVLNAYRMLSRLGDTRLAVESSRAWSLDASTAARRGCPRRSTRWRRRRDAACRCWCGGTPTTSTPPTASETDVTCVWSGVPFTGSVRVSHWRIDARHSNSHTAWQAAGCPQDPSESELQAIRARQGLEPLGAETLEPVQRGSLTLRISLPAAERVGCSRSSRPDDRAARERRVSWRPGRRRASHPDGRSTGGTGW
jgi:xylan 1,4-beta-xylosidase